MKMSMRWIGSVAVILGVAGCADEAEEPLATQRDVLEERQPTRVAQITAATRAIMAQRRAVALEVHISNQPGTSRGHSPEHIAQVRQTFRSEIAYCKVNDCPARDVEPLILSIGDIEQVDEDRARIGVMRLIPAADTSQFHGPYEGAEAYSVILRRTNGKWDAMIENAVMVEF